MHGALRSAEYLPDELPALQDLHVVVSRTDDLEADGEAALAKKARNVHGWCVENSPHFTKNLFMLAQRLYNYKRPAGRRHAAVPVLSRPSGASSIALGVMIMSYWLAIRSHSLRKRAMPS